METTNTSSDIHSTSPLQPGDEDYDAADVVEGGSNVNLFDDYDDGFGADNGGGTGGGTGDYGYDDDYIGDTGGFRYPSRRGDA